MTEQLTVEINTRDFLRFLEKQVGKDIPIKADDVIAVTAHAGYQTNLFVTITYYDKEE